MSAPTMLAALELTLGNLKSLKGNAFKNFDTLDVWISEVEKAIAAAKTNHPRRCSDSCPCDVCECCELVGVLAPCAGCNTMLCPECLPADRAQCEGCDEDDAEPTDPADAPGFDPGSYYDERDAD